MAFSDSFLEELRARNDIEGVISPYVHLKRAGRTLKGLCPFHNEKTPSFVVYPDTQSFYCFGCGVGGDVITFVRKIENLDYMESVKLLADRSGLQIPDRDYDDSMAKKRRRIYEMNKTAAKFFFRQLVDENNKHALSYFLNRGITFETIKHFGLGYAPDGWNTLIDYLHTQHFTNEEIFSANLARRSSKGNYYDNFRNRVIVPIIDLRGNVVAFGGRVLDDSKPKYINTSDTLVYKKTKELFGLNFAKGSASDYLILCEGYMDAIALHQAGFKNAVACCGTALTPDQVRVISRYTSEIVLSQDSDEAGRNAVDKAIKMFNEAGLNVRVLNFEGAKDPDEFIRKFGAERFKGLLEGASNDVEYKIIELKKQYDLKSNAQKAEYIAEVAKMLASVDSIKRDIYASSVSQDTGVSRDVIMNEIERNVRKKSRAAKKNMEHKIMRMADRKDRFNPEKARYRRAALAEERIIAVIIAHQDLIKTVRSELEEEDFVTAFNKNIYSKIIQKSEQSEREITLTLLSADLTEDELGCLSGLEVVGKELKNCREELLESITALKEEKLKLNKPDFSSLSDDDFRKMFHNE